MNVNEIIRGICFIVILIEATTANAQNFSPTAKASGISKFLVSLGSRLYFNERDVANDNVFPNSLSTSNPHSLNYQQALLYQRTTKYGLVYGAGMETGNRSYNLSVDYKSMELTDNPAAAFYVDYQKDYPFITRYWGLKVFVGYNYNLKALGIKNWSLEVTAGLAVTTQTKGFSSSVERDPVGYYFTEDNQLVNVTSHRYIQWGKTDQKFGGPMVGEFYIGVNRKLDHKYLRDINLGFTLTHVVKYPSGNIETAGEYGMSTVVTHYYYDGRKLPERPNSIDAYTPTEMSIGLKCAIGIYWKK